MPETQFSNTGSSFARVGESLTSNGSATADSWFCMFNGQEMGPLSFDDLRDFARRGQLGADDEVKLGIAGKWRRVGSIGRLVAVLPFVEQEVQVSPSSTPPAQAVELRSIAVKVAQPNIRPISMSSQSAVPATASPAPLAPHSGIQAGQLQLIKAGAAHQASAAVAKQLVAWAHGPGINPQWWTAIDGRQEGPVDFATVFDWAVTGRLKASDYVRNGVFGQFGHAANLPNLLSAVSIMRQANDAFELAKSDAAQSAAAAQAIATAAVEAAPVAAAPVSTANPTASRAAKVTPAETHSATRVFETPIPSNSESTQEIRSSERRPNVPLDSTTSSSECVAGSSTGRSPVTRPLSTFPKPSSSSRSSAGSSIFETLMDKLREPATISGFAVFAVVFVVGGWLYTSADYNADLRRYRELKQLLTEVRAKRQANATDFSDVQSKARKLSTEMAAALKSERTSGHPAKQQLLWAVRDELPRMMKEDPSVETVQEKNFSDRLASAAAYLKIGN